MGLAGMRLRPTKWLLYAPIAALPLLAAYVLNGQTVQDDIARRAAENLKATGADWAKLTVNGRDAKVAGDSPTQARIDVAIAAVAATYGVRRVEAGARVVPPQPVVEPEPVVEPVPEPVVELKPPTVGAVSLEAGRITASGTWDEGIAAALRASLAGKNWEFGKDAALASDGKGNWTLKSDIDLAPGTYDLVVEVTAKDGTTLADARKDEIVIAEPAPPPPPPPPTPTPRMTAPTVALFANELSPDHLSGGWDEAHATSLKVSIPAANLAATLGADVALTSRDGTWTLMLSQKLTPGSYDVAVETTDKQGRVERDQTKFEILVKEPPPPPPPPPPPMELHVPTVATYAGEHSPAAITGTWDEAVATSLKVSIPGAKIAAALGTDAALTSKAGAWTLALAQALTPGIYNVIVETSDAANRTASDATTAEIYIKTPPPPPPPPPPPYDCDGVLAKIGGIFPIRFAFDRTGVVSPYDLSVNQVAALLKDPRCLTVKALVTGHADYLGGRLFNRALSIIRAQAVVDMLVASGVDASRLSVDGKGKAAPLDPERDKLARAKNRRVVITIVK